MTRHASRLLLLATALAVAFSLWESRGQTYFSDEWGRWITYPDRSFEYSLHGASGHLIVVQIWVYRAVVEVFGAGSYLSFRLIAAALLAGCAWLFYLWAREEADPLLAAAGATILLFLGAAWEVVATPYGIVILLPVACGLAALNCVRRTGRRWRTAACALLVVGIGAGSFALPFLAGAAVAIALEGRRRFARDAWVVAIPLLLYAAWFVWTRTGGKEVSVADPLDTGSVTDMPRFAAELIAAGLGAATGLFRDSTAFLQFETEAGFVLLGLLLIAVIARLRAGTAHASRALVPLAMLLCYAVLIGLVANELRPPTSVRYLYPAALFSLLLLATLAPRRPLRRVEKGLLAALVAVSLGANIMSYHQAAEEIRGIGSQNRVALAALRQFEPPAGYPGDDLSVDGAIGSGPMGVDNNMRFSASEYMQAVDRFGDPAASPDELRGASPGERTAADRLLARAMELALVPAEATAAGRCRRLRGSVGEQATYGLRPRPGAKLTISTDSEGPGFAILARALSSAFTPIAALPGGFAGRLAVPEAGRPSWQLRIKTAQPADVCITGVAGEAGS